MVRSILFDKICNLTDEVFR